MFERVSVWEREKKKKRRKCYGNWHTNIIHNYSILALHEFFWNQSEEAQMSRDKWDDYVHAFGVWVAVLSKYLYSNLCTIPFSHLICSLSGCNSTIKIGYPSKSY